MTNDYDVTPMAYYPDAPVFPEENTKTISLERLTEYDANMKKYIADQKYLPTTGGQMTGPIQLDGEYQINNNGLVDVNDVQLAKVAHIYYDATNKCIKFDFNK